MQIITNKLNDLNTLILTISINKNEYKEKIEKLILEKKKNLQINGFRKGKVPINIIRNQYEDTLTKKYIEKLVKKYIDEYLYKEKIEILGDVLLIKQEINDSDDISFQFEIGILPEVKLEINNISIDYYHILFSNEKINEYIKKIKNYFNTIEYDKFINENDIIIIGVEVILKNKKSFNKDYHFIFKEMPKSIQLLLINNNNNINKAFYINSKDFFLKLKHLNNTVKYNFKEHIPIKIFIKKIYHTNKNINNYNYFNKIYGQNVIKSEEDFISKIKLEIDKIFSIKSDELLINSLISILINKTKINLPKNFLERWIQKKYFLPIEKAKEEYKNIEQEICKKLIKNKLYKIYNIENININKEKNNLENIIAKIINNEDNIYFFSKYKNISTLKKKLKIKNKYCSLDEFKIFLKKN